MNNVLLAAHGLHKSYKNGPKEIKAVNGISLEARRGESLVITGPSGSGKSTLLHLLGGLDKPTSGKVLSNGVDIYKLSDEERARFRNIRVGFIFQFYNLLPEFTALENVMLPMLITGNPAYETAGGAGPAHETAGGADGLRVTGNGARNKARGVLMSVGLEERAEHKPSELSGGEAQRVAIARALANDPKILLCDEPTGNLDSKARESIYELLFNLKTRTSIALVIVTHDEAISSRADTIIKIKDGKIV